MRMEAITTNHFVKNEDLNHHGTLFAGRTAEWFVEAGLMAAAVFLPAENIVCVKIHGMDFKHPVPLGSVVRFTSKAVLAGRTSLVCYIRLDLGKQQILDGFMTFVNVDGTGKPIPHGVTLEAADPEEAQLRERAMALSRGEA